MSENKKKTDDTPKSDSKEKAKNHSEAQSKVEKADDPKSKKAEPQDTKANTATGNVQPKLNKPRKRRGGLLGKRTKRLNFPIETLARRTGTDAVTLGALRVAYGWTKQTRLSHAEFLRLVDAWLKRPVKEA